MSFGPGSCGDAYDSTDSTDDSVDISDVSDVSADFSDNYNDASWDEASDMVACEIDDLASDGEDYTFEAAEFNDEDAYDGQLSLFETDDVQLDNTYEISSDTEDKEVLDDGQIDIEEFLVYRDDLYHTPSYESPLGEWVGERGDSLFIPRDEEAQRILSEFGLDGIPYHAGLPDFSAVTAATVYLSKEDMELTDAEQKTMSNYTLADDFLDEAFEVSEDEIIADTNTDLIELVLADEMDEFYGALLSGEVPVSFVWHHGDTDADGDYSLMLIPSSIHEACRHRGGRSHSGTSRQ